MKNERRTQEVNSDVRQRPAMAVTLCSALLTTALLGPRGDPRMEGRSLGATE